MTPDPFKWKPTPTRLTNLKIREVSSVDRGAGEDVKVAFWKADGARSFEEELVASNGVSADDDVDKQATLAEELHIASQALETSLAATCEDDTLSAQDRDAAAEEAVQQFSEYCAGLTDETAGDETRNLPTSAGSVTKEETDMHFTTDIVAVAKIMASEGTPSALYTRADFYAEIQKRAQADRRDDETREMAFARYAQTPDGMALFKAHRMSPGHDPDRTPAPAPVATTSASLDRLRELAADLHKTEPTLTREQAFTKVYTDPKNRELVAAERSENRPGLTVEKRGGSSPIADRVAALASSLARTHRGMTHDEAFKAVLQRNPQLAAAYQREQAGQ